MKERDFAEMGENYQRAAELKEQIDGIDKLITAIHNDEWSLETMRVIFTLLQPREIMTVIIPALEKKITKLRVEFNKI